MCSPTKKKGVTQKLGRWGDWLLRCVPELVKRPINNAFNDFKKKVMSLLPKVWGKQKVSFERVCGRTFYQSDKSNLWPQEVFDGCKTNGIGKIPEPDKDKTCSESKDGKRFTDRWEFNRWNSKFPIQNGDCLGIHQLGWTLNWNSWTNFGKHCSFSDE